MAFLSTPLPSSDYKMPRSTYTEALLGPEVYKKVRGTKVLVVGAGGIGCELRGSALASRLSFDLERDLLNIRD